MSFVCQIQELKWITSFINRRVGNEMPRFGGRATMMRLPFIEDLQGLDAAFVGIPLDIGTSQRSGTRYGPRYIRTESVMIRPVQHGHRRRAF